MRGRHPSDRRRTLKMSLQSKCRPGLDHPRRTRNGGLAVTFSGSHLSRTWVPQIVLAATPSKGGEGTKIVYRINVEAMRVVRKFVRETDTERERQRDGKDLKRSPRLSALSTSSTLTSHSTKHHCKGKTQYFSRAPLECSHALYHTATGTCRAQRSHFWRKKTQNKPCCSLRRKKGV